MLSKVIPIQRLPRGLDIFDYSVPTELKKQIKIGQLVKIPFRKSEIFGLVFECDLFEQIDTNPQIPNKTNRTQILFSKKNKDAPKNLKQIISIVNKIPFVDKNYLNFIQTMSLLYGVSIGTIAKMGLLPLQKRKLQGIKLIESNQKNNKGSKTKDLRLTDEKTFFTYYKNKEQHKKALTQNINKTGQTLILVPEVHLIDEVRQLLPIEMQKRSVVWYGNVSEKRKFTRWLQIKNKERNIIIGTRTASLLPFSNLKKIIIDYEHKENHKHWDQAPRFHAKDTAKLLSKIHESQVHLMSYSPSCESYFHIHKGNYTPTKKSLEISSLSKTPNTPHTKNKTIPTVINMKDERRGGNYEILADEVEDAILKSKKDIFIFINRLGYATSLVCKDCGFTEQCGNCKLPLIYHQKNKTLHCHYCHTQKTTSLACPKCQSILVQFRGAGTEAVEEQIQQLGQKLKHDIIRLDSERKEDLPYSKKPRIIIGTQMAFRHIRWEKTELIIFLSIDNQLQIPEYLAQEGVWHLIRETNFRRDKLSKFFIQTLNHQHLIFRSLSEPDRFYRTDLNARKSLAYPPYAYLVRYFYGNRDIRIVRKETQRVYDDILKQLTKSKKSINMSHPIEMHPRYYRNKFWYTILVKLDKNSWQEDLIEINRLIPRTWKIDPNPISVLSP